MDMAAGSSGTTGNSRWNPTKEQISMLENLYRQGIRTPTADQIQQITTRLKAFGTIEGKNVFYWFQNHKARQRQKQKQENLAYFNRYLHRTQPVYAPPPPPHCPNVVCGPYFAPQGDHLGFYPKCPKVLLPGGVKRKGRAPEKMVKGRFHDGTSHDLVHHYYNTMMPLKDNDGALNNGGNHETLALFPLHPTGVSEGKAGRTSMASLGSTTSAGNSITPSSSCETTAGIDQEAAGYGGEQHFFDFFSCQGSSEND